MFTMEHPLHGFMPVPYMADVEYNKKNGWKLVEEAKFVPRETEEVDTPEAAYERKFGKPPHFNMKLDTIIRKLEE